MKSDRELRTKKENKTHSKTFPTIKSDSRYFSLTGPNVHFQFKYVPNSSEGKEKNKQFSPLHTW